MNHVTFETAVRLKEAGFAMGNGIEFAATL